MRYIRLMLLFLLMLPVLASGQFNVKGSIISPSGDALSGVSVLLSTGAKSVSSTKTDEHGIFTLSNQPAGLYQLKCSAIGFRDTLTRFGLKKDTVFRLRLIRSADQLKELLSS